MTGTIITGAHLTGVYLNSPATENPATVTASGTVSNTGDALLGAAGTAWTVSNFGTIDGAAGVELLSGGEVINGSKTATKALIEGTGEGIGVGGGTAAVANYGTIEATSMHSVGVDLAAGGTVSNGKSGSTAGLIIGNQNGVAVGGAAATVTNFGSIEAIGASLPAGYFATGVITFGGGNIDNLGTIQSTGTTGSGINLQGGGSVTNGSGGATKALILGYGTGIFASSAHAATVTNYGTILSVGTIGHGVNLQGGGTVANFGTIRSTQTPTSTGLTGIGVVLPSGGVVINGSAAHRNAVISAVDGVAISIGNAAGGGGTVTNFGTVESTGTAVVPLAPAIYLGGGGTVTNYGLVEGPQPSTGGSTGAIVTHHVYATIRNFGTISASSGNDGIHFDHGGTLINGSTKITSALITGLNTGIDGGSNPGTHAAYGADAAVTVFNYGTIRNSGTGSVIGFTSGGEVSNHGLISGSATGIYLAGDVSVITNFGEIKDIGTVGEAVFLDAGGTVTNYGLISGGRIPSTTHAGVITVHNAPATLRNFGTIASTHANNGVNFDDGGEVVNKTTGSIVSANSGVSMGGTAGIPTLGAIGTVINYGKIENSGTAFGVRLLAGGTVINKGQMSSQGNGIAISTATGTVTNFGTVDAVSGQGAYLGAGGSITNRGLIEGGTDGVYLGAAKAAGHVVNSGTVEGKIGFGVAAGNTAGNALTNAGRIVGTGGTAVAFGGGNDVVTVDAGAMFNGAVEGSGGTDRIVQGSAGTLNFTGFSGFERIVLFKGGIDELTLKTANFAGVTGAAITVTDGNKGDTVNAAGIAAADRIIVRGGSGNDLFYAGGTARVTGGTGANEFIFAKPGSSTIKDFHVSGTNELVFSNAGFNLGLTGGTANPKELTAAQAATLFITNTTGKFTDASQRLAYDKSTGQLFASADGNASSGQLVATLTDHATIAPSQLFYIS